jgi:hypothetical protein
VLTASGAGITRNAKRDWKIRIIKAMNPDWLDLHGEIDPIATLVELKL